MKAWLTAVALVALCNCTRPEAASTGSASHSHEQLSPAVNSTPASNDAESAFDTKARQKVVHPQVFMTRWREAVALEASDPKANSALTWVLQHPDFLLLTPAEQAETLSLAAFASMFASDLETSHARIVRAITLGHDHYSSWYLRFATAASLEDHTAAASGLLHFVRSWPAHVNELDNELVVRVVFRAPLDSPATPTLITELLDSGWNNRGMGVGGQRYRLALSLLAQGKLDAARHVLPELRDNPDAVISVRSDRRFDGLYDRDDDAFDALSAARRAVTHLQGVVDDRPHDLQARVQLSYALLTLGQHDAVITLADEVARVIGDSTIASPPYQDMDQAIWMINNRAVALRRLGRYEEAQAELSRAASMDEHGADNVSQLLNLGRFLCNRGKPGEARAAIALTGTMSTYGKLVQMGIQHCAAVQQGDQAAAAEAMAHLHQNRQETPGPWIDALVLENRLDEAAVALADTLGSTEHRNDMLMDMQQYIAATPLPGSVALKRNWQDLLARDDVRRAIAKVGRIESYPIYGRIEY